MGSNRRINQIQTQTEVQVSLLSEVDVSIQELFDIWKVYVSKRIDKEKNIVKQLKKMPINQEVLDYFTMIGFELFAMEYVKGFLNGK